MDHRSPDFAALGKGMLAGMKRVFKSTQGEVVIYPASGTGAWEAALVNTLSAGDRVLMAETGHFATLWQKLAGRLGLEVEFLPGDWRHGADPEAIEKRLRADTDKRIKAVCVVHNETSTGVVSRIAECEGDRRRRHPALLHGRHHLVARLDRLPARRMGRRRHRRRLAEGPDAAAGPVLQLHFGQGARRLEDGDACRAPTGPGTRCWRTARAAISRTRRPPTCSTGCARR